MVGFELPKRTDANQKEIVSFFRSLGASVQILSDLGRGCPDLCLGFRGKNFLVEVKQAKGFLTFREKEFFDSWRGQVTIIRNTDEALSFFQTQMQ